MLNVEDNTNKFKERFLKALTLASTETFISELADIQSNTPVLKGDLKRSITGKPEINLGKVEIVWGSKLVYARKVEFKDKSYIRSTLNRDLNKIAGIFNKHIGGASK